MPSTIEKQTLTSLEFIWAESPSLIIRKSIFNQEIEQRNSIEKNLSPVFFFIKNNDLENLEKLITEYPEILNQKYQRALTPVFFAIEHNNLEALEILIKVCPEILEQKIEDDLTPIFFAIENNNLEALRVIIEKRPETLWQKYDEYSPIFFVINDEYLEAIKIIITSYPQIIKQEDVNKNTAIIKIVELYEDNPSEPNKNLLQKIFTQQFQKKLENEDIENLVKFVRNLYLLKLIYEDSGQIIRETMLKKILLSTLILDPNDEDDIFKQLILIYQKICQEKISEITFFNQKGEQNSLHIYNSEIKDHSSYFIFHVDEKNKLTAISYCDGNLICDERKLKSNYINGAITFNFKILRDFSEEMVKNFIDQNFREKDIDIIYDNFEGLSELFRDMINDFIAENFNERDANVLREKITESDFIKTTYSIPIQAQDRENCTFKSINILARFLLEQQQQQTIFGFDFINSQPYGIGHEAYKNVKERMVENATQNLILSAEKLGKEFCDKVKFFENIKIFLEKSSEKKTPATRFSQSSVEKITEYIASNDNNYFTSSRKRNFSQLL
jgi:ankyrin repeat protein